MKRLLAANLLLAIVFYAGQVSADDESSVPADQVDEEAAEIEIEYAEDAITPAEIETDPSVELSDNRAAPGVVNFVGVLREKGTRAPRPCFATH